MSTTKLDGDFCHQCVYCFADFFGRSDFGFCWSPERKIESGSNEYQGVYKYDDACLYFENRIELVLKSASGQLEAEEGNTDDE